MTGAEDMIAVEEGRGGEEKVIVAGVEGRR